MEETAGFENCGPDCDPAKAVIVDKDGKTIVHSVTDQTVWGMMDGKKIISVSNLSDGRIELLWEPVDEAIPEEMEYLAARTNLPVSRTETQARFRDDPMHYIFDERGWWRGIRCHKETWGTYMSKTVPTGMSRCAADGQTMTSFETKGWTKEEVEAFYEKVKKSPEKSVVLPKAE